MNENKHLHAETRTGNVLTSQFQCKLGWRSKAAMQLPKEFGPRRKKEKTSAQKSVCVNEKQAKLLWSVGGNLPQPKSLSKQVRKKARFLVSVSLNKSQNLFAGMFDSSFETIIRMRNQV